MPKIAKKQQKIMFLYGSGGVCLQLLANLLMLPMATICASIAAAAPVGGQAGAGWGRAAGDTHPYAGTTHSHGTYCTILCNTKQAPVDFIGILY